MKSAHIKPKKPAEPIGLTPAQLAESMVISVGETRKILGTEAKGLSDDEIAKHVLLFADLAETLIKYKHFAK